MRITSLETIDLRFPTSRTQAGTDATHTDPDYSAAYVILRTDAGLEGHGLTFTIGRGNDVCVLAIESFRGLVVGRRLDEITSDFAGFWRMLANESQLRWLGPERASSTWRWRLSSTRCGTCTRGRRTSRSGNCSPTCLRVKSSHASTSVTSSTR